MSGIDAQGRPRAGQVWLTRQGISLELLPPSDLHRPDDGLVVSASLPTSPQGSDHLILFRVGGRGPAYGLWGFPASIEKSSLSCWFSAPSDCHCPWFGRVPWDTPGFPAYSRLRTASSPMRGAAPPACQEASYLRTVIVTAAVYRRLDSELRRGRSRTW